jgi:hypothetical protein
MLINMSMLSGQCSCSVAALLHVDTYGAAAGKLAAAAFLLKGAV